MRVAQPGPVDQEMPLPKVEKALAEEKDKEDPAEAKVPGILGVATDRRQDPRVPDAELYLTVFRPLQPGDLFKPKLQDVCGRSRWRSRRSSSP